MYLALIVMLPFLGALLPPLLVRSSRGAAACGAALVSIAAFTLLLIQAPAVLRGGVREEHWQWLPSLGLDVTFYLDGLGLLFAGLILGIGILIIIFAHYYLSLKDPAGRFFTYLLLFQGAMVGIVLSGNVLLLVIFWELTSLSSFLLIGFWRHLPEARQGARMALIVTGAGGLALIGGMLILGDIAGSYELTAILAAGDAIKADPLYVPALLLILAGCFTKSAQFPFHFWLPHAMAAPTPVSAYLHSATMVKAGIFLMARLWPVLAGTDIWFYIVATAGLVTMVMAAWIALFKDDLKQLLAFSTVSHLGLVTMLIGFGTTMAAVVAVFHIINHATFKAALFMTAGIVDHEVGTRDARLLGGLVALMPITATLATIAAASMAGIPPLNGFLSKEMMLEEAAHTLWGGTSWLLPVGATLGALFSVAYSFRYIFHVFYGPQRDDYPKHPHDPPAGMWLPPGLLVCLVIAIGLAPAIVAGPLVAISAGAVTGGTLPEYHLSLWHGLTPALFMSAVAIVGGIALLLRHEAANNWRLSVPRPEAKTIFERILLWRLLAFTRAFNRGLHNGSLQRMLAMIVLAVLGIVYAALSAGGELLGGRELLTPSPIAIVGWALLVVASAGVTVLHRDRFLSLIIVGVIGLIVSVGFAYLSAPDLALTQISVEVVTVILMLLALNLLPKDTPRETPLLQRLRDIGIATLSGLAAGGAAFAVMSRDYESISAFHLDKSYSGGGGTNVVNVILVDFRGFDTFGEIIVLGIAALAIIAMIENVGRGPSGQRLANWVPDQARSLDHHPLMMVVATRIMLPISLTVAAYIFLRGHNEPGGGFIAGLIVAIAFVMQYMASGFVWSHSRMKFDYHSIVGVGVLIAAITGIAAWFADRPFLTSDYGYVHLPIVGEFELATAMAFDVGVLLTVVGAVMLALASLSRVGNMAEPHAMQDEPMDLDPSRTVPGEAPLKEEL
jgi:multicomponent K+:H+ antiporter subunit A